MKLSFLGAAKTVTGSAHLIEAGGKRLLVDFGMFQGSDADLIQELPCTASEIDYIVATHAHIDHTGHLPLLVKQGFEGPDLQHQRDGGTGCNFAGRQCTYPEDGYRVGEQKAGASGSAPR